METKKKKAERTEGGVVEVDAGDPRSPTLFLHRGCSSPSSSTPFVLSFSLCFSHSLHPALPCVFGSTVNSYISLPHN